MPIASLSHDNRHTNDAQAVLSKLLHPSVAKHVTSLMDGTSRLKSREEAMSALQAHNRSRRGKSSDGVHAPKRAPGAPGDACSTVTADAGAPA